MDIFILATKFPLDEEGQEKNFTFKLLTIVLKQELIKYLDKYLKNAEFQDVSKNGLQVDTPKIEIKKIGYAVDATDYIFDIAIKENVDIIIVHHGMFWGNEQVLVGNFYNKVKNLIKNDIGLYGCHLPLDAHTDIGNNIGIVNGIIETFGLKDYKIEEFGEYHGNTIGYGINFKNQIPIGNFVTKICKSLGFEDNFYNFGDKKTISSVAIISGGGGDDIGEAKIKNYDLYITGDSAHFQICIAKELGQSILLGGHYETETIGVKLLAKHLKEKFGIEIIFLDEKY
ncbi:MAG: Nif3-like dinuclear metal center hexameric protein [Candidatus Gracilibacteria bacterium]|nr:Nif3-like dinuclear metal center hexameric protein [Candidatus Gracilibacteria bacterium]MDD3119793.1 Nif3-like dinuclear metal center hexameric protein [Candidatus Gracilibacteria bacterium]MDD4530188.1 Nif3-like dinuclear metal center hexameric protein [Candidatus Gracilibacteria bacterium]